jgi:hypothetical protein
MTLDVVQASVGKIEQLAAAKKGPTAHHAEDALFLDLLRAIASGEYVDPRACAREAVRSADLEFYRWCE